MAEQEIIAVAVLRDGLEASLLAQVLQDEKIPFQLEPNRPGLSAILGPAFEGFARVWARPQDEAAVLQHLQDVRQSQVVPGKDYLVNGRMWRIKKT